ncbi:MAG: hypothetical protein QOF06_1159 [Solirubrobacterales bacterium]|jgi:hypothetical protein|nr:hypothetical protein [Solirubrobacterales bacterium]
MGVASAERSQRGDLIVSLKGNMAPLKLPRERPAPIAIYLEGGLQTADGSILPRVRRIELGLPGQGVLDTRGLPVCPQRLLRNTKPPEALVVCRSALVGHGRLQAVVALPNQKPFRVGAEMRAFNGRIGKRRAVVLHAYLDDPPTVVVLPFRIGPGSGRFGTALVADLGAALGPSVRFAHFQIELSRRFSRGGQVRSYLSASCPVPKGTAGFFSLAKVSFTLVGGRRISQGIARSCRAR